MGLIKRIFKIISFIFLFFTLTSLVLGFMVYKDFNLVKNQLSESEKIILISLNDKLIAGFKVDNLEFEISQNNMPEILTEDELKNINYENYLVLIIEMENVLEQLSDNFLFEFNEAVINKEDIVPILNSNNPVDEFIDRFYQDLNLNQRAEIKRSINLNEIKILISMISFSEISKENDELNMVFYLKEGIINIEPELFSFKLIKMIPNSIIEKVI